MAIWGGNGDGEARRERVERREFARRAGDELRYWLPLVMSIASTLVALGVLYGHLGGRLELIEFRLQRVEHALHVE